MRSIIRDAVVATTRPYIGTLQGLVILIARPYIWRELPGWERLFRLFEYRDWLWIAAPVKAIRGKVHGYVMHLNIAEWADRKTYFLGRWDDLATQLLMETVINRGDTVIDVGANRGMFALTASHLVGEGGLVICFEPNPNCLRVLRNEIESNSLSNVVVNEMALGSRNERINLAVPKYNSGQGTLASNLYCGDAIYEVAVEVKVGDDFLDSQRPSFLKIDVEGFETNVVKGLINTIRRNRPIIMTEVNPSFLAACGSSFEEFVALMRGLDYCGYKLDVKKRNGRNDWFLTNLEPENCDALWLHSSAIKERAEMFHDHMIECLANGAGDQRN